MIALLYISTTLILGLFAGSLLTEAVILLPYWRKLHPAKFLELHQTLGPQLFRYFMPLTIAAVILPCVTAAIAWWFGVYTRAYSLLAAILVLIMLVTFFVYFKKANQSFADRSVGLEGVSSELARWSKWHWFRTLLSIGAFVLSILALVGVFQIPLPKSADMILRE